MNENLLEVRDLSIDFRLHAQGKIQAVRGVSFRVRPGSTVALVGESGSGKSVITQAIMGVLPGSAELRGQILFNDPRADGNGPGNDEAPPPLDIASLDPSGPRMRAIRGGRISMIFQDPMSSLSPLPHGGRYSSPRRSCCRSDRGARRKCCPGPPTLAMLDRVGIPDPEQAPSDAYPLRALGGSCASAS